ncbi:polysaccharide biosynthesis/export family protein [Chromobacterium violaceum]|uniref:polysaccharide biosynthesis/export family protein n=1 Tax=Chromobacterium violaceum TaxID=536 RepID=UPI001B32965F|nr:polysaccharide biosynthesis/export family protein [Chromobacterium violaceum]MBP4044689.1 polysaccharide export protein [Chromobacterium violaceum]
MALKNMQFIFQTRLLLLSSLLSLSACSAIPLPSSGPSARQIQRLESDTADARIPVIEVNGDVTRRLQRGQRRSLFSEALGNTNVASYSVGAGDVLEISIWEAPPASLFGGSTLDTKAAISTSRSVALPEQMVNSAGNINVPFAGMIKASGRSPQEIEAEIVQKLKGKANQPQAMVRVLRNVTSNVTIVGEVANSIRMPLTAKSERLLDALAAAGGVRQPVSKMTLQITRGSKVQALPLETIIQDPRQNIVLQAGDVITALHQPLSLTVLGAAGKNEEQNFESQGITLGQALARAGGLQDSRADAKGVFVFRFEDPAVLDRKTDKSLQVNEDGKVPVVYQVDLKDPAMFFVAQKFPMQNKDVLYISNAPAAELQKFLNILSSIVYPLDTVRNFGR